MFPLKTKVIKNRKGMKEAPKNPKKKEKKKTNPCAKFNEFKTNKKPTIKQILQSKKL